MMRCPVWEGLVLEVRSFLLSVMRCGRVLDGLVGTGLVVRRCCEFEMVWAEG